MGLAAGFAAFDAADALHEPAAVARVDAVVAKQQAHHRVFAADLRVRGGVQDPRAEVARHVHLHRPRRAARAEAAAAERQHAGEARQERGRDLHRTVTVCGKAGTEPGRVAESA